MRFRLASVFLASVLATAASAVPYSWVTWNSSTGNQLFGTIPTNLGDVNVTVTGNWFGYLNNYPSWTPSASYADGVIVDNAPTPSIVQVSGTGAFTVAFDQPVTGVAMALWSVGNSGSVVGYDFGQTTPLLIAGGSGTEYGGVPLSQVGNVVYGEEGNGTLVLPGALAGYSFDVTANEFWHGFTIGAPTTQAVPEPASMAALGLGGLALLRRRKSRA